MTREGDGEICRCEVSIRGLRFGAVPVPVSPGGVGSFPWEIYYANDQGISLRAAQVSDLDHFKLLQGNFSG